MRSRRPGALRACLVALALLVCGGPWAAGEARAERVIVGDSARFSWAAASGPVSGYRIYLSRNGNPYVWDRSTSPNTRQILVEGAPGTDVRVLVRAWSAFDSGVIEGPPSPPSELVHFVAPPPPDDPPDEEPDDGGGSGGGGGTSDPDAPRLTVGSGTEAEVVDVRWYDTSGELEVGDFNADAKSDLFFKHGYEDIGNFWLMRGNSVRRKVSVQYVDIDIDIVGTGRFDTDERTTAADDVLVYSYDTGLYFAWQLEGGLITGAVPLMQDFALDVVGIADFDGDGGSDLLLIDAASELSISLLDGGETVESAVLGHAGRLELRELADVDGDGSDDILLRDMATGEFSLWMMDGTQLRDFTMLSSPGQGTELVDTADFDADGDADLLLQDSSGSLRVWLLENSRLDDELELGRVERGHACGTGDFDGDGVIDLVLCGRDRQVGVWLRGGAL